MASRVMPSIGKHYTAGHVLTLTLTHFYGWPCARPAVCIDTIDGTVASAYTHGWPCVYAQSFYIAVKQHDSSLKCGKTFDDRKILTLSISTASRVMLSNGRPAVCIESFFGHNRRSVGTQSLRGPIQ